jgi:hypothetical protein
MLSYDALRTLVFPELSATTRIATSAPIDAEKLYGGGHYQTLDTEDTFTKKSGTSTPTNSAPPDIEELYGHLYSSSPDTFAATKASPSSITHLAGPTDIEEYGTLYESPENRIHNNTIALAPQNWAKHASEALDNAQIVRDGYTTILHDAARSGDLKLVQSVVKAHPESLRIPERHETLGENGMLTAKSAVYAVDYAKPDSEIKAYLENEWNKPVSSEVELRINELKKIPLNPLSKEVRNEFGLELPQ